MPLFPFAAPRLPGSWPGKANSPKKSQVKKGGSNPSRQGGFGLTKAYLGAGPQASKSSKKPGNPAIPARMPVDRSFHKPLFIHQNRPSRRPAGDIDRLRRNMRIRRHWGIRQAVLFEGAGFLERQHWRGRRTSGHCSLRQCAARSWLILYLQKAHAGSPGSPAWLAQAGLCLSAIDTCDVTSRRNLSSRCAFPVAGSGSIRSNASVSADLAEWKPRYEQTKAGRGSSSGLAFAG